MGKSNQTVNEAQLKARRTSLGKKSNEELISIILRKDKTERSQSAKINSLMNLLNEANAINEEKGSRILNINKDLENVRHMIKVQDKQMYDLIVEKNKFVDDAKEWSKKYVKVKNIAKHRKYALFTCFGVITILIIWLVMF